MPTEMDPQAQLAKIEQRRTVIDGLPDSFAKQNMMGISAKAQEGIAQKVQQRVQTAPEAPEPRFVPNREMATAQIPVDVKTLEGDNLKFVIPDRQSGETEKGFKFRQDQATNLGNLYEIGAEMVDRFLTANPEHDYVDGLAATISQHQLELESEEEFAKVLADLPKNERNKPIRDKHRFDLMRLKGQKEALKAYFDLDTRSMSFQDMKDTGTVFQLDTQGNPLAPIVRDTKTRT